MGDEAADPPPVALLLLGIGRGLRWGERGVAVRRATAWRGDRAARVVAEVLTALAAYR